MSTIFIFHFACLFDYKKSIIFVMFIPGSLWFKLSGLVFLILYCFSNIIS